MELFIKTNTDLFEYVNRMECYEMMKGYTRQATYRHGDHLIDVSVTYDPALTQEPKAFTDEDMFRALRVWHTDLFLRRWATEVVEWPSHNDDPTQTWRR
jgi:hypothetical protein